MKNCANCGSLQRSAADDGLCDVCAHQSLYAMREVVGEQQATIERLRKTLQRFGRHDTTCGTWFPPYACDCGYEEEEEKR
jgi:hypothetical protein